VAGLAGIVVVVVEDGALAVESWPISAEMSGPVAAKASEDEVGVA
jgi:hypothetical protein